MAHIKNISLKKFPKVFRLCARFTTDYFDYKVRINSLLTDKNLHQLCRYRAQNSENTLEF